MAKPDENLKPFATDRQWEILTAVAKHGGQREAARKLKLALSTVQGAISAVKKKAAVQGYSPEHHMTRLAPEPFVVKGVSTYYNKDGQPAGQWVKSDLDRAQAFEIAKQAVISMAEDIPRVPPMPAPSATDDNLCNLYVMTDCHVGMLAWHKEGGADWDLRIAERTLVGCFEHMVASAPAARVGIVAQLGDWLHSDGLIPVTPTSHHILDQDGRFAKVVDASIRVLRRLIDCALSKHDRVVVLMAEGNHDMASSVWLRVMFRMLYENEPRIQVIDSELPYYVYQHGAVLIGFHHGHLKGNAGLPLLFAAGFPVEWGATKKRYCHTGHRHHVEEKEHPGMTVVQHPTLAARDAYAARGGWISERQACAITYHSTYGQVARTMVCPEMLDQAA